MRFVLSKRADGRAWILGGGEQRSAVGEATAISSYHREAAPMKY